LQLLEPNWYALGRGRLVTSQDEKKKRLGNSRGNNQGGDEKEHKKGGFLGLDLASLRVQYIGLETVRAVRLSKRKRGSSSKGERKSSELDGK